MYPLVTKNLFSHVSYDKYTDDVYYINNGKMNAFFLTTIAFNQDKLYGYSCEFLDNLKYNYHNNFGIYDQVVNLFNTIYEKKILVNNDYINIDEDVILLINSFSIGTVHGFSSTYSFLKEYCENIDTYINKKIIVYDNTEKGLLDIIYYFIPKNRIILIQEKCIYKFKSMTFIPTKMHRFEFGDDTFETAGYHEFITQIKTDISLYKYYKCVYIVKTEHTNDPITMINSSILNYLNKKQFKNIATNNELEKINIIRNCDIVVLSHGSSFYKNLLYISENTKLVVVFISSLFKQVAKQNPVELFVTKYKNAKVKLVVYDDEANNEITDDLFTV